MQWFIRGMIDCQLLLLSLGLSLPSRYEEDMVQFNPLTILLALHIQGLFGQPEQEFSVHFAVCL